MAESAGFEKLSSSWRIAFIVAMLALMGVVIYYVFSFGFAGCLMNVGSRYLVIALSLPFVFILFPALKGKGGRGVPWFDVLAAILAFAIPIYFFLHTWEIIFIGWATSPSLSHFVLAVVLCLLVLEGARRAGGTVYFFICLVLGLYPLFADKLPGILYGIRISWFNLIGVFAFGSESGIVGLPSRVMVDILIGFLIFAGILMASGGGRFFLNLATALFGRYRGGSAKVAVIGSGFFGSICGSAVANVAGTGSFTIPAMKKAGFTPQYAGAIEACASTGGILMPPVMGAVAFVMAEVVGVPYATIIICAAIPSILFYFGLLMQVDGYAARTGLKGLPKEEIPSLRQTMKEGWHFIFALLFLIWGLLYMRWEAMAPFYAAGFLMLLAMFTKETRIGLKGLIDIIEGIGRLVTQTMGIILPLAFIIAGLTLTGVAPAFTSGFIYLAGGNAYLVLIFGAIACYIMGMVGMLTPAYIFLAITMAPALVAIGFDVIAVHLFIIYYAMLAVITPPVALAVFVAAGIAGSSPMATAWRAMRLGIVIYFIPFFFIFNPALVFRGSPLETLYYFGGCVLGIILIASGLEGYLLRVGKVIFWARPLLVIAGLLLGFPEWRTDVLGIALAVPIIAILFMKTGASLKRRCGVNTGY